MYEKSQFFSEWKKFKSVQYHKELEAADQRIAKGEFFDLEEVENIVNGWD